MLSDHGFCKIENEVYLSPLLQQHNFLHIANHTDPTLENITRRTQAFALDPSRIYIHEKEKFPLGPVTRKDSQRVCDDLIQLFNEFEINGETVFKKIFFKEEIYGPQCPPNAPDLILLSYDGFDLKSGIHQNETHGKSHLQGMHRHNNAFFFISPPMDLTGKMSISRAGGIIAEILN
jgi:predicted AlkP superfamily phosphohydrolase/phosphomutase